MHGSDQARKRITLAIWSVGILAAIVIFVVNKPMDKSSEYRAEDSKVYVREAEKWGGPGELVFEKIDDTFISLWHGRRLTFTTVVLTAMTSGVYRFVTRR